MPKCNCTASFCVYSLWCGKRYPTVTCSTYKQIDCSKHRSCWSSVRLSGVFLFLQLISGCWYSSHPWSSFPHKITKPRKFPVHLHCTRPCHELFKETCISQAFSWINSVLGICICNTESPFYHFYELLNASLFLSFSVVRILWIMLIAAISQ